MAKMAASITTTFIYLFTVFLLYSTIEARQDFATPTGSNFTYVCDPKRYALLGLNMAQFPFCDSSLPFEVRARNLVKHMTLKEKVNQLGNNAEGVTRLGLPRYEWWSEALHGVSYVGPGTFFDSVVPGATSFPPVILTAAAFNESLWKNIGEVVSTEARAMYNLGRAGLTFWSPNINVVRDPRWGRALETPGEDPFVVGTYATNYVRGLQDVKGTEEHQDLNTRPLKVSSFQRYDFDARVQERDMVETFLRPFEMCVKDGDVSSVMCSYNKVNGIPSCADPKLLNQTVRRDWNLHGYIVSDCDSIEVMLHAQHWLGDAPEDAVAQTLKAGLDLDCGKFYPSSTESSVRQGKVREETIDTSLTYLYVVLMRLGFFDGSPQYECLGKKDICTAESIELATEAAREGIVLLKNDDQTLPLKTDKCKSIALIGTPCRYTTPFEGLSRYASVDSALGCWDVNCGDANLFPPALKIMNEHDATILVMGIDLSIEAESRDRSNLLLPNFQPELIKQIADSCKGPVILVLFSAGGLDITFAKNHPNIKAIIWAGYPGEEGGAAIADVIFGKYNPGGRLPLTWYENSYVDMIPITAMRLRPVDELGYPGRTYKFFNGSTVYPFGYGLSYTKFNYSLLTEPCSVHVKLEKFQPCYQDLEYKCGVDKPECPGVVINEHLSCHETVKIKVSVQNVGSYDGSEVVMVYHKAPEGIAEAPIKELIAFRRVFIKAGESATVEFDINVCKSFQLIDFSAYRILAAGTHTIVIGDDLVSLPVEILPC
ncbi:hypothetical protein K2173_006545 [Erythroxylum novogranatense]|uniref:Fibronectin type III-like domain-containing protein n=1 Tax=Erythroxylum novogranatense TaxID=1862640 RepID=A0AAV8T6T8_9ROSI|nr:hypothetical protein K2173_006545 [Erythroxylum novogranatense]